MSVLHMDLNDLTDDKDLRVMHKAVRCNQKKWARDDVYDVSIYFQGNTFEFKNVIPLYDIKHKVEPVNIKERCVMQVLGLFCKAMEIANLIKNSGLYINATWKQELDMAFTHPRGVDGDKIVVENIDKVPEK